MDQIKLGEEKYSSIESHMNATVNAIANQILDLMRLDRNVTIVQLAEITSKQRVMVARSIKTLKEAGMNERVGSDKTGYWRIL